MKYPVQNWSEWYSAQDFGVKTSYGYHEGSDVNLKTGGDTDLGEDVLAIADGEVTSVHNHSTKPTFGLHIHIKHVGPWGTVWCHYAHCNSLLVDIGQKVTKGQKIGTLGKSGTDVAHLHWAIKLQPTGIDAIAHTLEELQMWTDPIQFVEKWLDYDTPPADDTLTLQFLKANKPASFVKLEAYARELVEVYNRPPQVKEVIVEKEIPCPDPVTAFTDWIITKVREDDKNG